GTYSATVDYDWSGTVTPTKAGYTFAPANRVYSNVTSDQTSQDYTPTLNTYTISGSVGTLDGVTMSGLPGNPVTAGGTYSATVDYDWSGTVTPTKAGYTFDPANRVYSNVTSDQTSQDYTPTPITYTWHVDYSVENGDGTSWETAFDTIQEAIDAATTDEDEIWVKAGTYVLTSKIQVDKAIGIYGGFAGTEADKGERDWRTNETRVDGGGSIGCFSVTADATIDGFIITNGNARAGNGGGIEIVNASPTISNCTFS
ncbi:unnamed protein product, partial [marine sediment metagenome]